MPYRVIVWGTGNVGQSALRTVVSNPVLELTGVIVANPEKVARDAGDLCGLAPTRITSYNVCYTKLLRISPLPIGRSIRAGCVGTPGPVPRG